MTRTVFKGRALAYLLVLPQVAVTIVFFFWPAAKSLWMSLYRSAPFGGRDVFVGLENFTRLLTDPDYYASVMNSFVFAAKKTAKQGLDDATAKSNAMLKEFASVNKP